MRKLLTTFLLFGISVGHASSWNGIVFDAHTRALQSKVEFFNKLSQYELIVIGEKHYTGPVQKTEAEIIEEVLKIKGGEWTLGWEFLNHTEKTQTDQLWSNVEAGNLTVEDFLLQTQKYEDAIVYAPVFEVLKSYNGNVLGLNLTRAEKAPVTQGGIAAVELSLLPPHYAGGSDDYRERFQNIMQGHASPEQLNNYYDAQCLTDDVMAYQLLTNRIGTSFLIAGSFHTEFFGGTVERLRVRDAKLRLVTVQIVDASDYKESELLNTLENVKYGAVADFVVFVNEPQP